MKRFRGLLIMAITLVVILSILSFLLPSRVVVVRAVSAHADSMKVFNEVSELKNWPHWQPVFRSNAAAIQYSKASGVGSFAEWETDGKMNRLTILKETFPTVTILLQRKGNADVVNSISVFPVAEPGSVQIQWQAITNLQWWPWEKFGGILIEKMSGAGYDAALQSLQQFVESH